MGVSAPQSVTVTVLDTTPPTAPANLTATAVLSSQINLSWTASTDNIGVVGYRVYRNGILLITPIITATSYSDPGLTPSTLYSYYVVAYDAAGNISPISNTATATTLAAPDTTPPAAIGNLSASNPTFNSMMLSWTAPGDDGNVGTASVYDLRYSISPITSANWASASQAIGEPAPLVAGTAQSMTVSGLNPAAVYYFAIKTRDEVGNESSLSNVILATTNNLPDTTPPAFTFTSPASLLPVGTTAAVLSGTTNETATCRYATLTNQNFDTGMTAFATTGGSSHSQAVSGLTNGSTYTYYVKCRDSANNTSGDFTVMFSVDSPAPDLTPPVISNGQPMVTLPANTASVTMSVRTSEPAYCSYNQNADISYGAMPNAFTEDSAQTYHSVFLSGLANGASYLYYVRCQDTPGGNENAIGYPISFSVATPPNVLPVANMTAGPLSGDAPLSVTVDGSASYDTDGTIAQYVWRWGDGTPDATGPTASHTYATVGTYALTLTVTDNQGGIGTTIQTITVTAPPAPPPVLTTGICAPECVQKSDCAGFGPDAICASNGICVVNGAGGAGPVRDSGAFYLPYATSSQTTFPAGTNSIVMKLNTDVTAQCQYSTTSDVPYGDTTFMKQFSYTASTTHETVLAIPKMSVAAQATQTYNYYIRCKDSQTGDMNTTNYNLSFTVGGPAMISGPSSYICWINQNFVKNSIPYLFDICRPME